MTDSIADLSTKLAWVHPKYGSRAESDFRQNIHPHERSNTMSGGHFEYRCFQISQFAEELKHEIKTNTTPDEYGDAPNYSEETIKILTYCQQTIEYASNLAKEVEWLYSSDTGEENLVATVRELIQADQRITPHPPKESNHSGEQCTTVDEYVAQLESKTATLHAGIVDIMQLCSRVATIISKPEKLEQSNEGTHPEA